MPLPRKTIAVATHDPHSSFIKTPQQLIVVVVLSFLIPVIAIIALVHLVLSRPGADPGAMTPQAITARIEPVGRVEFGPPQGAAGSRSGEQVVKAVCAACHQAGVAGAPKIGDKAAWGPRIKEGLQKLVKDAIAGIRGMPPRGGDSSLTDDEVARAVVFMTNQSGAKFKEPAPAKPQAPQPQQQVAAAPPAVPQAPAQQQQKPGAADGKAVFDKVCMACHATGVGGAPKVGDKEAWAPRIKTGMDSLLQSALKGKGAMPPKGGDQSLTDAQLRAAIDFMVSQSK